MLRTPLLRTLRAGADSCVYIGRTVTTSYTELHHSISATTQPACPQANTCLSIQRLQCATIASYSPLHIHSYPSFTPLACSFSPSYAKHSSTLLLYCTTLYLSNIVMPCIYCIFLTTRYIVSSIYIQQSSLDIRTLCWTSTLFHAQNIIILLPNIQMY